MGCSVQYLSTLSRKYDWPTRRSKMQASILGVEGQMDHVVELAVVQLRTKLARRLTELDLLCQHKNPGIRLKAILAWLSLVPGLKSGESVERGPQAVQVYNDLRDQRQIVVQSGQEDADEPVVAGELGPAGGMQHRGSQGGPPASPVLPRDGTE